MGYLFRISKGASETSNTIVDWSNTSLSTYHYGFVNKIEDTTSTQNEITSIPSPFARIELVKEAFRKVVGESINNLSSEEIANRLHGTTIYHKMVSDSLDVGQIFFNYPSMKDRIEIKMWSNRDITDLIDSDNPSHSAYGRSLKMFFEQDSKGSDPYNFGKMQNIYILRYIGPGQKQMHIIGATSPATLFFSTANDESDISRYLSFGTDHAFDKAYGALDQRDPEYLKYFFTLKYSIPHFERKFPEVSSYLDAVYRIISDELKAEINNIQNEVSNQPDNAEAFISSSYDLLKFSISDAYEQEVEVIGYPIHSKIINVRGNTDFEIQTKKKQNLNVLPLVLPVNMSSTYENHVYYGCKFGREFNIPFVDEEPLESRLLPGINIRHPYLTISDFLDDKIIKLPSEINSKDFFDGKIESSRSKVGYLLPLTKTFFDCFSVEDLMGQAPSGKAFFEMKELASGVEVVLRVPISKGEIEYKRIYTLDVKADKTKNIGAIVIAPEDFAIGVFPPIAFENEKDAHYRIAILSDFGLNVNSSCMCYSENESFFEPEYVVRNVGVEDDIRSKVYLLEGKSFESAFISITTDQPGRESQATGVLVPKFRRGLGNTRFMFAVDFGTSNTHIEYTSDINTMPVPFEFDQESPQFSLVCKPSDLIRMHISGEFIPEKIGLNSQCHFPMRTVLCIDKVNAGINENGVGPYIPLGNASPAFMYNKADVGTKYNDFVTNLKWSQINKEEDHISHYLESLFLMIRTKVIQEGGSISQTQIKWFYPISMSNNKLSLFRRKWNDLYHRYFNPESQPIAITESIAPYSFFQQTRADVTDIVTIDIGGGTTDIVVADNQGVKLVTSVRFAADAIFGNGLVPVQNGSLNGIIKQFKDEFIEKLEGFSDLRKMLIDKTQNNLGNSTEVASFLFSLEENMHVRDKRLQDTLSFNKALMSDNSQKIVFYIFFCSIIYHIAHLMKAKNLTAPANIAFSGNGSKVLSVLDPEIESNILGTLTTRVFSLVYESDVKTINVITNPQNPKEATCKGGLFLTDVPNDISAMKEVLLGTNKTELVDSQVYQDVEKYYDDVVKEVKSFVDLILLRIPRSFSLKDMFGIDQDSLKLAGECFNKDLKTYIDKGVNMKIKSGDVDKNDVVEESLFFYPIIGVINDLSESIFKKNLKK